MCRVGIEFNVARRNAIDALRCYRERYQHVDVPHMFVVPPAEPWPRNTHRMPLGSFVRVIRKGMFADDPDFRRELDLLGFRWDHPEHQPKLVETEAEKTQRLRARIEKALPGFYEFEANRISYADHMNMRVLAEDRVDLTLLSELDRERYLFLREVRALKRPGWNPVATLQQKEDTLAYDEVAQKQIRAHLEEHEVQQQMDAIVYWIMRQYNLTETLEDYANKLPGPSLNATMGLEPLVLGGEHTAFARKYNPYKDTKNLRIPFDMAAGYKLNAMYEAMINSPMVHERGTAWFGLNVTAIDLSKRKPMLAGTALCFPLSLIRFRLAMSSATPTRNAGAAGKYQTARLSACGIRRLELQRRANRLDNVQNPLRIAGRPCRLQTEGAGAEAGEPDLQHAARRVREAAAGRRRGRHR